LVQLLHTIHPIPGAKQLHRRLTSGRRWIDGVELIVQSLGRHEEGRLEEGETCMFLQASIE
jgi:hypothetical protein